MLTPPNGFTTRSITSPEATTACPLPDITTATASAPLELPWQLLLTLNPFRFISRGEGLGVNRGGQEMCMKGILGKNNTPHSKILTSDKVVMQELANVHAALR